MNRYIGIDVHQDKCHGTVLDEDGITARQGYFQNSPSGFKDFFDGTGTGKVAIEATDAWQPVYDWLTEKGFDVKLAHPHKTRIIAEVKIKTDCRDSEALADLVRADLIAEVYVPCDDMRELRGIAKQRGKLVQERSKYKNRTKAQLRKRGIEYKDRNIWTKSGKQWLRDLEINAVNDFLEVLKTLNDRISKLEEEIEEIAGDMEEARLLMTIPGVSYYTALTIIAEIATIERFPSPEHLCSYAGLVPSVKQSGSKEVHGPISGGRPLLRWIIYQATHNHKNNAPNSHVTEFYKRLEQRKPKKLAKTAAARKLTTVIYWMLKLKEEFHPKGYDPRTSR
ncbi:hypothetical protein AKJ40_02765 [candidate division MSBL1 archaeon SCGC-AAA259M10]|uniref:Uncharacterized protein n=1 Tax=candidate division MSBL1 archaeon SCGC-AAA259M10 TaxID=1698270 RepID=A0A133UZJ0_9EURY|nr:hypothetical protein AKJ40_02765 [candidate division MSBL1 archaeon SCGC-AAA259M10]